MYSAWQRERRRTEECSADVPPAGKDRQKEELRFCGREIRDCRGGRRVYLKRREDGALKRSLIFPISAAH